MPYVYKGAGTTVAKYVSRQPGFETAARGFLSTVRSVAARHAKTGAHLKSFGIRSIPGKKGVRDRLVYTDDPAAMSIEFGHLTPDGKHVPGLRVFAKAISTAAIPGM